MSQYAAVASRMFAAVGLNEAGDPVDAGNEGNVTVPAAPIWTAQTVPKGRLMVRIYAHGAWACTLTCLTAYPSQIRLVDGISDDERAAVINGLRSVLQDDRFNVRVSGPLNAGYISLWLLVILLRHTKPSCLTYFTQHCTLHIVGHCLQVTIHNLLIAPHYLTTCPTSN